jgi:hypothetical protein
VPESWIQYGGVMLPMYQSEALWLSFHTPQGYPFAVKVATGKQSAITGDAWREGLHRSPEQDYLGCRPDGPPPVEHVRRYGPRCWWLRHFLQIGW